MSKWTLCLCICLVPVCRQGSSGSAITLKSLQINFVSTEVRSAVCFFGQRWVNAIGTCLNPSKLVYRGGPGAWNLHLCRISHIPMPTFCSITVCLWLSLYSIILDVAAHRTFSLLEDLRDPVLTFHLICTCLAKGLLLPNISYRKVVTLVLNSILAGRG